MGVQVSFNYAAWIAAFPEFAGVSPDQANILLGMAVPAFLKNDGTGPVTSAATQTTLLNLLIAHFAQLLYGSTIQPANGGVGRVNNASEGSVSVQLDYGTTVSQQQAFFLQTKYGAMFWQASAPYRTMRYIPGHEQAAFPGGRFGRW